MGVVLLLLEGCYVVAVWLLGVKHGCFGVLGVCYDIARELWDVLCCSKVAM